MHSLSNTITHNFMNGLKRITPNLMLLIALFASQMTHAIPSNGGAFIFQLDASSNLVKVGKPIHVSWTTLNAFSCNLMTNLGNEIVSINGSKTIVPIDTNLMVIQLLCVNQAGAATAKTISQW